MVSPLPVEGKTGGGAAAILTKQKKNITKKNKHSTRNVNEKQFNSTTESTRDYENRCKIMKDM